jgi:antitoxin component of MazEF toxin-antitoxin module
MRATVRKLGNSSGVIIRKSLLHDLGMTEFGNAEGEP